MHGAAGYGLVQVHVPITNLNVKAAIRVGADPRFVMDGRSLASKVGQWYQVSLIALLTLGY